MYREYFCYQQLSIEIDVHVGKKEEIIKLFEKMIFSKTNGVRRSASRGES
jgi:hypothetical protein